MSDWNSGYKNWSAVCKSCYALWKSTTRREVSSGSVLAAQAESQSSQAGAESGARYGCRSRRPIPPMIDQTLEAELPDCCPHCGGELEETKIEKQYQAEIPQP
jgi:hypothetical protein